MPRVLFCWYCPLFFPQQNLSRRSISFVSRTKSRAYKKKDSTRRNLPVFVTPPPHLSTSLYTSFYSFFRHRHGLVHGATTMHMYLSQRQQTPPAGKRKERPDRKICYFPFFISLRLRGGGYYLLGDIFICVHSLT